MSAGTLRAYTQLIAPQPGSSGSRYALLRNSVIVVAGGAAFVWFARAVMHSPKLGAALTCVTMLVWLWMSCGGFAVSAARQNQPAYACLVPHLHRRLMICCVAMAVFSSLALAVTISMAFDYRGWSLALTGLLFPSFMLMQRYPLAFLVPGIFGLAANLIPEAWLDPLAAPLMALGEPGLWTLCVAADIALMALALRLALPRGGDRHFAVQDRIDFWSKKGTDGVARRTRAQGGNWDAGYHRALRRAGAPSATQEDKMLHALGAPAHEGAAFLTSLCIVLLGIAIAIAKAAGLRIWPPLLLGGPVPVMLMASLIQLLPSYVERVRTAMASNRGEQELYRLSPSMPMPRDVNRALAKMLLRRFAKIWLVVVAALMCLHFAMTGRFWSAYPFAQASLTLPFACLMLRDYARMDVSPRTWRTGVRTLCFIAASAVYIGIVSQSRDFPWLIPATIVAVGSLLVLWRRWVAMMQAPPAFPAGRLAQ